MYRISQLAEKVGLSRSTLLYYEKQGLISSKRMANGYRTYSEQDLQQLKLLLQLQAGGLTLKECQAYMETRIDRSLLLQRLRILDDEISAKQQSRQLLASLLGMSPMRDWHQNMEAQAPEAHLSWLMSQGFNEKQALRLRWLSKDMNGHQEYMRDFEQIFSGLDRLGPGSTEDSLRALKILPKAELARLNTLLEIGCGRGTTTALLAEVLNASITALDNEEYNLSCLRNRLTNNELQNKVLPICGSMTELPFKALSFDIIWAEGSAYIMGFEKALAYWQTFIGSRGYLVITDLVWLKKSPQKEVTDFWTQNYPDIKTVEERRLQIKNKGYQLLDDFTLSDTSWSNYTNPLAERVSKLIDNDGQTDFVSNALADIKKELTIHQNNHGDYGYQFFILQKET